jgi:hypothetical protein
MRVELYKGGYSGVKQFNTVGDYNVDLILGISNQSGTKEKERVASISLNNLGLEIIGGQDFYNDLRTSGALIDGKWHLEIVQKFAFKKIMEYFSNNMHEFFLYLSDVKKKSAEVGREGFKNQFKNLMGIS